MIPSARGDIVPCFHTVTLRPMIPSWPTSILKGWFRLALSVRAPALQSESLSSRLNLCMKGLTRADVVRSPSLLLLVRRRGGKGSTSAGRVVSYWMPMV